jgi:hypothetical protein
MRSPGRSRSRRRSCPQAVRDAAKNGHTPYVVVGGTAIPIDWVAADRPFHSGNHQEARDEPAGHRQPEGDILGVFGPLPGSVHYKKAESIWESWRAGGCRPDRPGRQGLPGRAARESPYKAEIPEGSQQDARETALTRASARTPSSSPGASSASSAAPLARLPACQGYPRIADPRGKRMMKRLYA